MANKNAIDKLAQQIIDNIENYTENKINKAQYDQSYYSSIYGINQEFITEVDKKTSDELINTYKIPESVEEGLPYYYTIKLKDKFYCVKSLAKFGLYEEVIVYVPNNNWSRMYIDTPKANDVKDGVGEDLGNHNERFNDYANNIANGAGSYNHLEGELNQVLTSAHHNSIGGMYNTAQANAYCNIINGENNTATSSGDNIICGHNNSIAASNYNIATGEHNQIISSTRNAISGLSNFIVGNTQQSFVTGNDNTLINSYSSMVVGTKNEVTNGYDTLIFGEDNKATQYKSVLIGKGLRDKVDNQVIFGKYNSEDDGVFIIGGGDGNGRKNLLWLTSGGDLHITGKLYSAGGTGGSYTAGSGITISTDNVISLNSASNTVYGGITLGRGLEINEETFSTDVNIGDGLEFVGDDNIISVKADDGINVTEDGVSLKIGSGLEFVNNESESEDSPKTLTLSKASDIAFGGIILGNGLEYNEETGKVDATGGGERLVIENAVILSEDLASYFLHNYSEISYVVGQRAVYGTPPLTFNIQGIKTISTSAPVDTSALTFEDYFKGNMPQLLENYSLNVLDNNNNYITYNIELVAGYISASGRYDTYARYSTDGGATWKNTTLEQYVMRPYHYLRYDRIYHPAEKPPYGAVAATVTRCGRGTYSGGAWRNISENFLSSLILPFNSKDEYNVAMAILYEPDVRYRAVDNGSEIKIKGSELPI